jgi:hypothetical protein
VVPISESNKKRHWQAVTTKTAIDSDREC